MKPRARHGADDGSCRPPGRPARGDEGWHFLADPEANEFCLLRTQLPGRHDD
ncbi:MAG: hypothetical protein ACR2MP_33875 [Streptosporangiaceae bacterium]